MKDLYLRLRQLATALDDAGSNEMAEQVRDALDRIWYYSLTEAERAEVERG